MNRSGAWILLPALTRSLGTEIERLVVAAGGRIPLGGKPVDEAASELLSSRPSEAGTVRKHVRELFAGGYLRIEDGAIVVPKTAAAIRMARLRANEKAQQFSEPFANRSDNGDVRRSVTVRRTDPRTVRPRAIRDLHPDPGSSSGSALDPLQASDPDLLRISESAHARNHEAKPPGDGASEANEQVKRGSRADRAKRGSRCPASAAELEAIAFAQAHGLPWLCAARGVVLTPEVAAFLDHHAAKGTLSLDWAASWRTWQRNAARFGRAAAPAPSRPRPGIQPPAAPGREGWRPPTDEESDLFRDVSPKEEERS